MSTDAPPTRRQLLYNAERHRQGFARGECGHPWYCYVIRTVAASRVASCAHNKLSAIKVKQREVSEVDDNSLFVADPFTAEVVDFSLFKVIEGDGGPHMCGIAASLR